MVKVDIKMEMLFNLNLIFLVEFVLMMKEISLLLNIVIIESGK